VSARGELQQRGLIWLLLLWSKVPGRGIWNVVKLDNVVNRRVLSVIKSAYEADRVAWSLRPRGSLRL
jgi:hypothetical protein